MGWRERGCWILTVVALAGLAFYLQQRYASTRDLLTRCGSAVPGHASTPQPAPVSQYVTPASAAAPAAPPSLRPESSEPQRSSAQELPQAVHDWFGEERTKEVERFIALSPQEREELSGRLKERRVMELDAPSTAEILQSVLGQEKVQRFYEAWNAALAAEEATTIQRVTSELSSSLGLTPDQESAVAPIVAEIETSVRQARGALRLIREEAAARHEVPDPSGTALRETYRRMKELTASTEKLKADLYRARLRQVLSDEQYNAYLGMRRGEP
jgi:hypothetical protein